MLLGMMFLTGLYLSGWGKAGQLTEGSDLNELMTDTAAALAQVLPNPGDWPGWLVILLRELER